MIILAVNLTIYSLFNIYCECLCILLHEIHFNNQTKPNQTVDFSMFDVFVFQHTQTQSKLKHPNIRSYTLCARVHASTSFHVIQFVKVEFWRKKFAYGPRKHNLVSICRRRLFSCVSGNACVCVYKRPLLLPFLLLSVFAAKCVCACVRVSDFHFSLLVYSPLRRFVLAVCEF